MKKVLLYIAMLSVIVSCEKNNDVIVTYKVEGERDQVFHYNEVPDAYLDTFYLYSFGVKPANENWQKDIIMQPGDHVFIHLVDHMPNSYKAISVYFNGELYDKESCRDKCTLVIDDEIPDDL